MIKGSSKNSEITNLLRFIPYMFKNAQKLSEGPTSSKVGHLLKNMNINFSINIRKFRIYFIEISNHTIKKIIFLIIFLHQPKSINNIKYYNIVNTPYINIIISYIVLVYRNVYILLN